MILGIDIGGTTIKAGIINKKGSVIKKVTQPTQAKRGKAQVLHNIKTVISQFDTKTFSAIGIGMPGGVRSDGYITHNPNLPLKNFHLGSYLKKEVKKKVVFANDADVFALACFALRKQKKDKNIVALTLGTGIGSGVIIDGNLFSRNGAPELGHMSIKFDAKKSSYKNTGCLEQFMGRANFSKDPLKVFEDAKEGSKKAKEEFKQYGSYLGVGIANSINIFNPDTIVLGGEIRHAYTYFKDSMNKEISNRALFKSKVVKSTIADAGIIGAALLASNS